MLLAGRGPGSGGHGGTVGARGHAEHVEEPGHGGRLGRLTVSEGEHLPVGPGQRRGLDARVARRPEREARQRRDAQARRDERLDRDEVVGGERDVRSEAGQLALPDQVAAAALAAADPPVVRIVGQVRPGRQRGSPAVVPRASGLAAGARVTRWMGSSSSSRDRVPSSASPGGLTVTPSW